MAWVQVKAPNGVEGERFLRADSISVISIRGPGDVSFSDNRGNSFVWKTSGTVAEYGKLAALLGLAEMV